MSVFHTEEGSVNYSGIRRYLVVKNGSTTKRSDSAGTAAAHAQRYGGVVVDTSVDPQPANPVCRVCGKGHVEANDYREYRRHWWCIPRVEQAAISAEWRRTHS